MAVVLQFCHVFLYPTNRGQSRCSLNYGCGPIFKTLICIVVSIIYYGVFPAILRVDVGAELDETGGDVDPAVERRHVERRAVVVVSGLDERGILLEELPHSCGVVLVRVPEYQRRATHSLLLLLLLTAVAATRTHRFFFELESKKNGLIVIFWFWFWLVLCSTIFWMSPHNFYFFLFLLVNFVGGLKRVGYIIFLCFAFAAPSIFHCC